MKAIIFPTNRAVKDFYESKKSQNSLLDKAFSVVDFFENLLISDKFKASEYESLLLMQKACQQCKKSESVLKIPSNFFAFLKNYEYLFSFFKELCLAKKEIKELKNQDFYALYDEHLDILEELLKNYLSNLHKAGLFDDLSIVKDYSLNLDFLKNFDGCVFELENFLNAFEIELLLKISLELPTILRFKTSKFNVDFLQKLPFFENLKLEKDKFYEFDLSAKKLLKKDDFIFKTKEANICSFELESLQTSFVFNEISKFIRAGINPQKIVVITPNESFCELLRVFDKNNMLNFASGISVKESFFYQSLKALFNALNDENFKLFEGDNYFETCEAFDLNNTLLQSFELKNFKLLKENFLKKAYYDEFLALILPLSKNENEELKNKLESELNKLKSLIENENLSLKELLELFLTKISKLKTSFVGGGAVTVMGLLESRNLSFDGVIVVDFNDEFIPKKSVNEMFLNDSVRTRAGLISHENRENMQRFYYESLFKTASKISICYVESEERVRSSFLEELGWKTKNEYSQKAFLKALELDYKPKNINLNPLKALVFEYDLFESALSASKFQTFLNHKRSFFYKYILKIKEPRALSTALNAKDVGSFLHELLESYYKDKKSYFSCDDFIILLKQRLEKSHLNFSKLDIQRYELRFKEFEILENEHFESGFMIYATELDFMQNPKEITLNNRKIKLRGVIDRIDERNGTFLIIDYKSGKIDDKSYQLAFYELIFDKECEAYFYDLKTGEKIPSQHKASELKDEFLNIMQEKEICFKNSKKNEYCPYKLIYEKDLK